MSQVQNQHYATRYCFCGAYVVRSESEPEHDSYTDRDGVIHAEDGCRQVRAFLNAPAEVAMTWDQWYGGLLRLCTKHNLPEHAVSEFLSHGRRRLAQ